MGLEIGADDYITKPFDIEELKLRVVNAIQASDRVKNIDGKTNLPTGRLIEDHLRDLMRGDDDWTYIDIKINGYTSFSEVYTAGRQGTKSLRFATIMIGEIVDQMGTSNDFIGNPGQDNFVVITHTANVESIIDKLTDEFENRVKQHYSFIDRERGYILVPGDDGEKQVELMNLAIGSVSTRTHQFSDIREITELAAEDRRGHASSDSASDILTSW